MAIKKKTQKGKHVIDITGPQGNAYFLLGTAMNLGKQLGFNKEKQNQIQAEMSSGDYEHLIQTFDNYFGDYVDLER